jgi:hypothetical protein
VQWSESLKVLTLSLLLLILEECCELWEEELKIENASDEPPQGIKTGKEARGILQSKQSKICPLTVSGLFYFTENEQHAKLRDWIGRHHHGGLRRQIDS